MKEKSNHIYGLVVEAMLALKSKKITTDEAKAIAALAKQANNTMTLQVDVAKFLSKEESSIQNLKQTGFYEES